jgi:hypothetical protein
VERDQDRDNLSRARINLAQVTQVVIYVVTIMLAYSALDRRITTLEVKYDRIAEDLREIKADVKVLLERQS